MNENSARTVSGSIVALLLLALFALPSVFAAPKFESPKLALVISKASLEQDWEIAQMSAHGWGAIVNMAGIPYDCLFIEDLAAGKNLQAYQLIVFTACETVADKHIPGLAKAIKGYLQQGGNLILDNGLAIYSGDEQLRSANELEQLIGFRNLGYKGDSSFRIKVTDNHPYPVRDFEPGQLVSQNLAGGLNVLSGPADAAVVLSHTNEAETFPFLTLQEGPNRIALISDLTSWSGALSFFRNAQPQVFFANMLYPIMVDLVHWAIYGELSQPIPVPQLTNADVAAIIRHDGDGSDIRDAQVTTMNFMMDIARESGVVPVYSWVSSGAAESGWETLAPLGKQIEELGGQIGTHSRYHHIDDKMTPARWEEELTGSVRDIEQAMTAAGYPIGKVAWFINPGNTIRMTDYPEVASRFSFYMTHGFEQDVPLGWGNLTWFSGGNRDFILMENITAPDYQWFYDPEWSYTTAQATAYEEAVWDHLMRGIGRGAIFNEMWHDYSITTQPQRPKERIINSSNIGFYQAMKSKFAVSPIYCPTPADIAQKLRAMAQWKYTWEADPEEVHMTIDYSGAASDSLPEYTGGMGLRIENTAKFIQAVEINGQPHYGFRDQLVVLPNLKRGLNAIIIHLGKQRPAGPHLRYVSKRMPAIRTSPAGLEVELLTQSKARFTFYSATAARVRNADWQEWNRNGDGMLHGYVTSNRTIVLEDVDGNHR